MPCSACDSARKFPSKTNQINSTKKSNYLKTRVNNISRTYGLPSKNNYKSKIFPLGICKK